MSGREMFTPRELTVSIGRVPHKLFLQDGFYNKAEISSVIHHHKYTEVHLILGGEILYSIGEEQRTVSGGTMLVIPPGVYHAGLKRSEAALCAAFQVDAEVEELRAFSVSPGLIAEFFTEIDRAKESGDYSGVAAFADMLCLRFVGSEGISADRIADYGFLIHEFFSHRYADDVALADLAEALHLSERQTERIVAQHTGGSFRDELARSRIRVAERLLAEGEMSLGEISAYVGYKSYAGFWKAMKKHGII